MGPGKRSSRGDSVRRRSSQVSVGSSTSISELLEAEDRLSASHHSLRDLPSPGLDNARLFIN